MTNVPKTRITTPRAHSGRAGFLTWVLVGLAIVAFETWNVATAWRFQEQARMSDPGRVQNGLLFRDTDDLSWIQWTQQVAAGGPTHWLAEDNYPHGRPVHWASPFRWCLEGAGRVVAAVTGRPLREAIPWGAMLVNPLLIVAFVGLGGGFLVRRFGPLAGGTLMAGLAFNPVVQECFHPLHPDHQSLILALSGVGFIALVAALGERAASARRAMLAGSGVAFGAAIWVSAINALAFFALVATALLGFVAARVPLRVRGADWLVWTVPAAAVGLLGSCVEYGLHPPWRLEIGHPIYAGALAGLGLVLAAGSRARARGGTTGTERIARGAGIGMMALPAVFLLAGGSAVFSPGDPVQARFLRTIVECRPLPQSAVLESFGLLGPLALVCAGLLALAKPRAPELLALVVAAGVVLMGLGVARLAQFAAITMPLLVALFLARPAGSIAFPVRRAVGGLAIFAVALNAAQMRGQLAHNYEREMAGTTWCNLARSVAAEVNRDARMRGIPPVVLSTPDLSSYAAAYLDGHRTVARVYWENTVGMNDAAVMLTTGSVEQLRSLLQERGVTHIVQPLSAAAVDDLDYLLRGPRALAVGRETALDQVADAAGPAAGWITTVPGAFAAREGPYRLLRVNGSAPAAPTPGVRRDDRDDVAF